jgi:hypothetical protein
MPVLNRLYRDLESAVTARMDERTTTWRMNDVALAELRSYDCGEPRPLGELL